MICPFNKAWSSHKIRRSSKAMDQLLTPWLATTICPDDHLLEAVFGSNFCESPSRNLKNSTTYNILGLDLILNLNRPFRKFPQVVDLVVFGSQRYVHPSC